ncbi:MAG: tetratricopeptide repeat protein [Bacteroidales bacterium]|nr:tetratricopeptide repeat protein [Bacteroidales bacterium]
MKSNFKITHILFVSIVLIATSCSTEKNTSFSRFYQGFTTRYNVFYNGETNFEKASKSQLQNYSENFTQLLPIHPVSKLKGQMNNEYDRTIEKCQKAIRLHSIKTKPTFKGIKGGEAYKEWQKTEEYNQFLHQVWLTMAKSQFYKGDFMAASSTFSYIIRHFRNLPHTVLEAQIWSARCLAELKWLYEAEDILHKIKPSDLNATNKTLWNLAEADLLLKQQEAKNAIPYLEKAISGEKNKTQRYRLNYLLGQIYAENGENIKAYAAFDKVVKLSPPYEVDFSARIRQTECIGSEKSSDVLKKLLGMTKKSRNKDYLDQLYYAIGNIYLNKKDTIQAIKYYSLAIEKGEKSADQKSLSQIKLGDIFFTTKKYPAAQPLYSEAIATIGKEHPDYTRLSKRSEALDELIIHYQNVHLQDSLLHLASLPDTEKLKIVQAYIAAEEKRESDEKKIADREKLLLEQASREQERDDNFDNARIKAPTMPNLNGDKSWYFYNTASVSKGKADFQSRWGSRKFEDNWRRKNKASNNFGENKSQNENENSGELTQKIDSSKLDKITDPKNPQYYIQQLPKTDEEIKNANDIVIDGLYNMALVYKNRLEDFPLAVTTFYQLTTRYPNTNYLPDAYYNLYLIGQQTNDNVLSEKYKSKLVSEFPTNKYSVALSDPNFIQDYLKKRNEVETLYEETYTKYLKNDIKAVRATYELAKEKYPLSKLMPKFAFLNALSMLSEKRTEDFKNALSDILTKYPDSDISTLVGGMMSNLAQGKQISGENTNSDIWNSRITEKGADADKTIIKNIPEFTVDPISPHFILFVYPADSTYNNRLMYEVAGFNFTNFAIRDFDFDMLPLQGIGMLRVKGFTSFNEVQIYFQRLFGDKGIAQRLPSQLKTVLISEKNFESLLKGRTFAEYFTFFDKNFKKK